MTETHHGTLIRRVLLRVVMNRTAGLGDWNPRVPLHAFDGFRVIPVSPGDSRVLTAGQMSDINVGQPSNGSSPASTSTCGRLSDSGSCPAGIRVATPNKYIDYIDKTWSRGDKTILGTAHQRLSETWA
jgi:hypothetical protein